MLRIFGNLSIAAGFYTLVTQGMNLDVLFYYLLGSQMLVKDRLEALVKEAKNVDV